MRSRALGQLRSVVISALLLGVFAALGTGIVAGIHDLTVTRIAANQRAALLEQLQAIIPAKRYDNDPVGDTLELAPDPLLGTDGTTRCYRFRRDGQPVAVVLEVVAPDGYSGPIRLLVGVHRDASIAGVRVVEHRETPGLGDGIEAERSDWIHTFQGRTLGNPPSDDWEVKPDGGSFDALTGATITPRAVVHAVRDALKYFRAHREHLLFAEGRAASQGA